MNKQNGRRPPQVGLENAVWHRSSYSTGNGACVEITFVEEVVAVRDSKDTDRPALAFSPRGWHAFLETATDGRPHQR